MKIVINVVPHDRQRYKTAGDWFFDGDNLFIKVSDMGNEDFAFLVAIHEMVEAWLCKKLDISEEEITKFDMRFEANRKDGNTDEPGDDVNSPYADEHLLATGIEKIICSALGIKWAEYDKTVNNL
ncbi:MAG: hypothetical protein ACYDBX_04330 [Patescibacteria group bacterium]